MTAKHLTMIQRGCILSAAGLGIGIATLAAALEDASRTYWAYQPPERPEPPEVDSPWVHNPIDAFILEGLRTAGLEPNPDAETGRLLRRVAYDVTGLAPSPELLARAGQDLDQDTWGALIDELLASPHFGEKLASLWLDVVRYAETNGFERDSEKPFMWRYRDYVIRAFNQDKPYDRFLLEQLAGDELADGDRESAIATGFMTLMQRDDEPADRVQSHSDMISDIVDVTGEAFMGTTMGCAKCHDHKGDPIRQADYYSMMAFFDGIQQHMLKAPTRQWVTPEAETGRQAELEAVRRNLEAAWSRVDTAPLHPLTRKAESPRPLIPLGRRERQDWQVLFAEPENPAWTLPSYPAEEFTLLPSPYSSIIGGLNINESTPWRGTNLTLRAEVGLQEIPARLFFYAEGNGLKNLTLTFNGDVVFDGLPERVGPYFFVPFSAEHLAFLTTGKNVIGILATCKQPNGKWLDAGFYQDAVANLALDDLLAIHPDVVEAALGASFTKEALPLVRKKRTLLKPLQGEPYMGVNEVASMPAAHIHERGNANVPGEPVPLAFPAVLCPDDEASLALVEPDFFTHNRTHGRRLAFAQWLTGPDHPLTARVMVNRLWQHGFGVGLVPSANDFGTLGERPSNQALLDWLAVEFVESGWSVKHMLRLMLTSHTYRLSVTGHERALQADPLNRLHWRHNPRRLTAEEIRDTFLAVTGELHREGGGPPVRPKMPDEVLATASKPDQAWPPTRGPEANRRSVYVHVKRSIHLPILASFDAPERDASCPVRFATTVPTQALTLLNSAFVNDRARRLAERVTTESEGREGRIARALTLALGRDAGDEEIDELNRLCRDLETEYHVPEEDLMQRVCLVILNLNETLYLD